MENAQNTEYQKIIQIDNEIYKLNYMAKKANCSALLCCGDMRILGTVCIGEEPIYGEFMPLSVQYIHKLYAVGKIPGGYVKRESKPSDFEVLTSRIIDRALRPLFPSDFRLPVHISVMVLSYSGGDLQTSAFNVASLALYLSGLSFVPPTSAERVEFKDGVLESSALICASKEGILMLELQGDGVSEDEVVRGIQRAQEHIFKRCDQIQKLETRSFEWKRAQPIQAETQVSFEEASFKQRVNDDMANSVYQARSKLFRDNVLAGRRIDRRELDCVREIEIETNILPCAHGSALFTRGSTQALCVATIGSSADKESREELLESKKDSFMFQYNFHPFSVGEASMIFNVSRREIGHGHLAKKALQGSVDKMTVVRLVSEILESDGSSSMASVCAGSLALNACGAASSLIAGVAMGLVKDGDKRTVLVDINELEDHYGDMDCKIAGTKSSITAMQMDTKISNVTIKDIQEVLKRAKIARVGILEKMQSALLHININYDLLPSSISFEVPKESIPEIIGAGGRVIKEIIQKFKVSIDLDKDRGGVKITGRGKEEVIRAKDCILRLTKGFSEGEELEGRVKSIVDFGAFVELDGLADGLVHSSKITRELKVDEIIRVRILSLSNGKISLDLA